MLARLFSCPEAGFLIGNMIAPRTTGVNRKSFILEITTKKRDPQAPLFSGPYSSTGSTPSSSSPSVGVFISVR